MLSAKQLKQSQQLQTTIRTANRISAVQFQNSKRLVSAFDPFDSNIDPRQKDSLQREAEQAIEQLNEKYIELFHKLLKKIGNVEESQDTTKIAQDKKRGNSKNLQNQRQNMYRQKCSKYLKQNCQIIQKIKYSNKIQKDWKKVQQFLKEENQGAQIVLNAEKLIGRFAKKRQKLAELEKQHEKILKNSVGFLQNYEPHSEGKKLSNKEREFKKIQKKMNKQMEKAEFYGVKGEEYHKKLQAIQKMIQSAHLTKQQIQVKLIQQEQRRKRRQTKSRNKLIRSKSVAANFDKKKKYL